MLEINNVYSGYDKKEILKDITVSVMKGKLTSVIGPNGCGKTTLLKTLSGIISPCSGDVKADNISLALMKRKEIARKISYLSQGKSTPDMTVMSLVLHGRFPHLNYPRRYSQRDLEMAEKSMEIMGIREYSQRALSTLSGGIRQAAYIAMALCQDSDFILMDEPNTFLDPANSIRLLRLFRDLKDNGKGIVTVLHDLGLAFSYSDRVIVMNDGRVVMCDDTQKVYESGIINEVFGVKLKKAEDSDTGYYYER